MAAHFFKLNAPDRQIFEKLNIQRDDMQERYNVSKLLEVLLVRLIGDQKSSSQLPVTINCVKPGLCQL